MKPTWNRCLLGWGSWPPSSALRRASVLQEQRPVCLGLLTSYRTLQPPPRPQLSM